MEECTLCDIVNQMIDARLADFEPELDIDAIAIAVVQRLLELLGG